MLPPFSTPDLEICESNTSFNFGHRAGFLILLSTSDMKILPRRMSVNLRDLKVPSNVESVFFNSFFCASEADVCIGPCQAILRSGKRGFGAGSPVSQCFVLGVNRKAPFVTAVTSTASRERQTHNTAGRSCEKL